MYLLVRETVTCAPWPRWKRDVRTQETRLEVGPSRGSALLYRIQIDEPERRAMILRMAIEAGPVGKREELMVLIADPVPATQIDRVFNVVLGQMRLLLAPNSVLAVRLQFRRKDRRTRRPTAALSGLFHEMPVFERPRYQSADELRSLLGLGRRPQTIRPNN